VRDSVPESLRCAATADGTELPRGKLSRIFVLLEISVMANGQFGVCIDAELLMVEPIKWAGGVARGDANRSSRCDVLDSPSRTDLRRGWLFQFR